MLGRLSYGSDNILFLYNQDVMMLAYGRAEKYKL